MMEITLCMHICKNSQKNWLKLYAKNRGLVLAFQQKVARLQRAAFDANKLTDEMLNRVKHLKKGLFYTPEKVKTIEKDLNDLNIELNNIKKDMHGDFVIRGYSEPLPPSVTNRIQEVIYGAWASSADITETHKQNYNIAAEEFETVLTKIYSAVESLHKIEEQAEIVGTPFTPGRVPQWKKE